MTAGGFLKKHLELRVVSFIIVFPHGVCDTLRSSRHPVPWPGISTDRLSFFYDGAILEKRVPGNSPGAGVFF